MLAPPSRTRHQGLTALSAHAALSPLPIAFVLLTFLTVVRVTGTVDSDVAWQLWIAQRMHAGADLYRDIVETNPPLWFWMAWPVERLSTLTHLRIEAALALVIAGFVALSLAATNKLLDHLSRKQRTVLLSYAVLILFLMPWTHIGQREQIALIGTLPYAALIAARRDGRSPSVSLAAAIGAGAAVGFALKHYFLLVPLLLEIWLLTIHRREWRPFRPETLALGLVGAAYAAATLLEHDYLVSIVPLLKLAYGTYAAPSFLNLFGPFAAMTLAIACALLLNAKFLARREGSLPAALTIAGLAFGIAYFIQFKGWTYHAIPMLGCASLALGATLTCGGIRSSALRLIAPALLCLPLSAAIGEALHATEIDPDLEEAIAGLPPGTPVAFIAENTALAWSVTLQRQFAYPQRYNGYWMLGALVRAERSGRPDPGLEAAWRKAVADTVDDFRCLPPRRIIVARPQAGTWNAAIVDPLPYFTRDPQFAQLLAHYRVRSRSTVEVYEQMGPLTERSASGCSERRS